MTCGTGPRAGCRVCQFGARDIGTMALRVFRQTRSGDEIMQLAVRLGLLAFLLYWSFVLVRPFIPVLAWSMVLTVALYQPYEWLSLRLGGRPKLAAVIVTVTCLLIIIGPATWLGLGMIDGLQNFAGQLGTGTLTIPSPPEGVKDWPLLGAQIYGLWNQASTNLGAALGQVAPHLKPLADCEVSAINIGSSSRAEAQVSDYRDALDGAYLHCRSIFACLCERLRSVGLLSQFGDVSSKGYLHSAPVYSGINCWAGARRLLWVRSRSCLQPISLQNHSVSVRVLWHLQSQTQGVVDGQQMFGPRLKAGPVKCCTTWIDGGGGPTRRIHFRRAAFFAAVLPG